MLTKLTLGEKLKDLRLAKGSSVGMDVELKSMIHEMYSRDISTKIRRAKS